MGAKERIVYFLGAGFSAPLGLPLMGDFYFKSLDLHASDPVRYAHFGDIFNEIRSISVTKNYYAGDLFNVEEILSILEMRAGLTGFEFRDAFVRYLCDVVKHYTPSLVPFKNWQLTGDWHAYLFGHPRTPYQLIATFVANLLNLMVREIDSSSPVPRERFRAQRRDSDMCCYALITVNYDLVIEPVVEYIKTNFELRPNRPIHFVGAESVEKEAWNQPAMVKLHGSIETTRIVPPTWSKGVHPEVLPAWQSAHRLLRDATQIRILGYSLPMADAYVKYLFKAAVSESPRLKALDVICLDPDGSVRKRYEAFIKFRDFRFQSARLEEYFSGLMEEIGGRHQKRDDPVEFRHLETVHNAFMKRS